MITYFATTNFRNHRRLFGIKAPDRRHHMYIIGKTGVGKSTLLKTMLLQDIRNGCGCVLFDPHGDLAQSIDTQGRDLFVLDAADREARWHFNPLAGVPECRRALAASGMVEIFEKLWSDAWGPRLEHVLRQVALTLLELPGSSFAMIPRLLTDRQYRRAMVARLEDRDVRAFWQREYAGYSPAFQAVVAAPLLNKISAFLADPALRRIVAAPQSSFDLRDVMDTGKVMIVNLAKGTLGDRSAGLLGSLLVSSIALAGLSRSDTPEHARRDFYVYLDEFHTLTTRSLATMLAELRKYRVNLILAHQYLGQLDPVVRDAVFGNVGTFVSFRVGAQDVPMIAREFAPRFDERDLVALPNYHIYLRLMIDGVVSRGFSANTSIIPAGLKRHC